MSDRLQQDSYFPAMALLAFFVLAGESSCTEVVPEDWDVPAI